MATDPRRLFDQKDALIAALYAKTDSTKDDVSPLLLDSAGNLCVNVTVGTLTISSTASTITNAVGNPVNVSLTNTVVTIESTGLNVTPTTTAATITNAVGNPVNVSLTSTLVTVDNTIAANVTLTSTIVTAHISPSTTVVTVHISPSGSLATVSLTSTKVTVESAGLAVNATLTNTKVTVDNTVAVNATLTSTAVTVSNGAGVLNVNVATATLGTVTVSGSVSLSSTAVTVSNTPTVGAIQLLSKTLTGVTGSVSATWTSVFTPTNKAKIFAFSLTTTSASEVIVLICDGAFANAKEKWRATLMAPSGANSGANLAVSPPGHLFATRSTSAVTISLSTAVLVHYSLSFYDEA